MMTTARSLPVLPTSVISPKPVVVSVVIVKYSASM